MTPFYLTIKVSPHRLRAPKWPATGPLSMLRDSKGAEYYLELFTNMISGVIGDTFYSVVTNYVLPGGGVQRGTA